MREVTRISNGDNRALDWIKEKRADAGDEDWAYLGDYNLPIPTLALLTKPFRTNRE
jgi:hypothetical protein